MSTEMTRRNAIMAGGTAVAGVALCALVPAAVEAAPNPDAELIALEREYWGTTGALCEAENAHSKALFALHPERPECLSYLGRDRLDGTSEPRKISFVSRSEVDSYYASMWPTAPNMRSDALAEWDRWEAESGAAENDPHVAGLRRKADALSARAADIREQIFALPAAGPAGLAVKLRLATGALWEPGMRDKFRNGECEDMLDAGALSAMLDCERLSGVSYPAGAMGV